MVFLQFDNETPGKTIRRLRIQKGMSQELLSGFAGIARSHLSMIENAKKSPSLETMCKIALALDMLPSELIQEIESGWSHSNENL